MYALMYVLIHLHFRNVSNFQKLESEGYFDALDAETALNNSVSNMVSIADEEDILEEQEVMSHNLKRVLTKPKLRREQRGLHKREASCIRKTSAKRSLVNESIHFNAKKKTSEQFKENIEVIEILSDDDDDDDDKEFWNGEVESEVEVLSVHHHTYF